MSGAIVLFVDSIVSRLLDGLLRVLCEMWREYQIFDIVDISAVLYQHIGLGDPCA